MKHERPLSALLGRGASWSGDLSFEGRVRIDGTYRGRIFTEDVLEVGENGMISGDIDVATLIIAGNAEGSIRVRERLLVESTGVLKGTVDAKVIEVRPGGRVDAMLKVGY
jgi:cytoskeletal protein CcmA (bactofilin family)